MASRSITGPICTDTSRGIADLQFARGADDHLDHPVGDVLLHAEQPQRRAALAGGAEGRRHDVVRDLLGQRGRVDDHGVDAAGLGDQRHDRAVLGGERAVDEPRHLGRAGEDDARDVAVRRRGARRRARRRARGAARRSEPRPRAGCRTAAAATSGVCSAGFATTALPAASAAATWPRKIASGKFQGEIATKTPRPRRRSTFDSPVGPGSASPAPNSARACDGVVAAEIDRLAHLRDRVVDGLAGLRLEEVEERARGAPPGGRPPSRAPAARRSTGRLGPGAEARAGGRHGAVRAVSVAASTTWPTTVRPSIGLDQRPRSRPPEPRPSITRGSARNGAGGAGADLGARAPRARPGGRTRRRANSAARARRGRAAGAASGGARAPATTTMSAGRRSSVCDRHARIGRHRHEGGVGAVLQEPAHEIGEEVAVAADRRVGAAGGARMVLDQAAVERLAHAVQALELVAVDAARALDDRGDRERVVGGELRVDARAAGPGAAPRRRRS